MCLWLRQDKPALAETRDRGAEMGLGGVPEFDDKRVAFESVLNDAALYAAAAAMNQTNFTEASFPCRVHVFLDHRLDVARLEGMEVQRILDRDAVRHGRIYEAVTTVLMPPRTEKSPTTVMRRG